MLSKRIAKEISNKDDIEYLLQLTEEDLLKKSTIMELFGEFGNKRRFEPYDTIIIPPDSYGPEGNRNKNAFKTTVGIWVFNRVFIEKELFNLFQYINKNIDSKRLDAINEKMSYSLIEDKIELENLKTYIKKCQKFMPFVSILSPSYTMDMLLVTKKINAKKQELIKKYKKELDAGDELIVIKMQDELMEMARTELKDDPCMDIYNSGARGKFNNHFKNMFIMKGLVKDPDPTKGYNTILSNQIDGVSKEEYSKLANALAAGPYARGKKTQIGGWWEKLFLTAFQHLKLDPKGSDCGTTRTITAHMDDSNWKMYMYSYMVEGSKLVELTYENKDKYMNKDLKFRFASLCESKTGICNKCAGEMYYRLGNITNIGVNTPQVASKLKLISMKAFHDSQVKMIEMDVMKAFGV